MLRQLLRKATAPIARFRGHSVMGNGDGVPVVLWDELAPMGRRPLRGLYHQLTPEQQRRALSYDGLVASGTCIDRLQALKGCHDLRGDVSDVSHASSKADNPLPAKRK